MMFGLLCVWYIVLKVLVFDYVVSVMKSEVVVVGMVCGFLDGGRG